MRLTLCVVLASLAFATGCHEEEERRPSREVGADSPILPEAEAREAAIGFAEDWSGSRWDSLRARFGDNLAQLRTVEDLQRRRAAMERAHGPLIERRGELRFGRQYGFRTVTFQLAHERAVADTKIVIDLDGVIIDYFMSVD